MKTLNPFAVLIVACALVACETDRAAETAAPVAAAAKKVAEFDTPPSPDGGFAAFQKNLKYPAEVKAGNVEGKVVLSLKVDAEGGLESVTVLKSSGHPKLDHAAVNAAKATAWSPATKGQKSVSAEIALPVVFKLN